MSRVLDPFRFVLISLLGAGISDDLIIAKIQKSGQTFDLSTDDMVRLKKAGSSDAVMKAMMSATPAPATVSAVPVAGPNATVAPSADVAPNLVAENPNMGKLKKEGFMATIGQGVSNAVNGKSVSDRLTKLLFPEAGDEPIPHGHPVECR